MAQDTKHENPIRQAPRQDRDNPRLQETTGPERYQSEVNDPDASRTRNPGQANPAHNTPGQDRKDQAGQHDKGEPGQAGTQSYPGTKGPKTRALEEDSAINRKEAKEVVKKQ